MIQASDRSTLNALLLLHEHRLQGYRLKSYLMGFEYEATTMQMMGADASNPEKFEQMFTRTAIVQSHQQAAAAVQTKKAQPLAKQSSTTAQEDEFEVTKTVVAGAKHDDDDDEF